MTKFFLRKTKGKIFTWENQWEILLGKTNGKNFTKENQWKNFYTGKPKEIFKTFLFRKSIEKWNS